jgi:hypothetical protein
MQINIELSNGAEFTWRRVLAGELSSIFVEIADLAEKDSRDQKAAKKYKKWSGKVNGTKAVRKVNKAK